MANYMTADEYAAVMGIHPQSVRQMCARGDIKAIKVGKLWRIPEPPKGDEAPAPSRPAIDEVRALVARIDEACAQLRALRDDLCAIEAGAS